MAQNLQLLGILVGVILVAPAVLDFIREVVRKDKE